MDTNRDPNRSNEIYESRARIDELKAHNETLKKDLDQARQDKDDLKKTFDNYMVQVQTLINQKAVEAPGAEKQWWRFWQSGCNLYDPVKYKKEYSIKNELSQDKKP